MKKKSEDERMVKSKMTFTQWLYYHKNFNSKTHFNKYIKSLNVSIEKQKEIVEYYKEDYKDYLVENN